MNDTYDWSFLGLKVGHCGQMYIPYSDLKSSGRMISPRGLKTIELMDYECQFGPYVRFAAFVPRKLNLSYIKREFLWYLRGDRFDTSIVSHAKMWGNLISDDGGINSNYGQYIFGKVNQFKSVFEILRADPDSRRGAIVILRSEHVNDLTSKDVPCTYCLSFRIRENYLHMSVRMRSQDAILGFGNDIPTFSFIHEMMYEKLKVVYPELKYGNYSHIVDSFHIYERHFEMLNEILSCNLADFELVQCPRISSGAEVDFLLANNHVDIPEEYYFTKWLYQTEVHIGK